MDSEAVLKTVQILIRWLHQKPSDLDLHCFSREDISGFRRGKKFIDLALEISATLLLPFLSFMSCS